MLVLSRRLMETVVIGDDIRVTLLQIGHDKVRIGIEAPTGVVVDRGEVRRRKDRGEKQK